MLQEGCDDERPAPRTLSFFTATAPIAAAYQIVKTLYTVLRDKPSFWAHGQMDLDAEGGYKYLNIGVGAGDVEGTTKAILKGMHQSLQEYADAVNQELGSTGDARLGVNGLRVPEVLVKGNDQGRAISVVLFYQHPREGQTFAAPTSSLRKLAPEASKSIATDAIYTWTTCGFGGKTRLKRAPSRATPRQDCARGAATGQEADRKGADLMSNHQGVRVSTVFAATNLGVNDRISDAGHAGKYWACLPDADHRGSKEAQSSAERSRARLQMHLNRVSRSFNTTIQFICRPKTRQCNSIVAHLMKYCLVT